MMLSHIRNSKTAKVFSALISFSLIIDLVIPSIGYAVTGGPSQPDVHQSAEISLDNMVDPFTGDFTYNIPLFELPGPNGGYPFNISYSSGVTMEQEASWVGLGWSLSPGAISRTMRGIPDEYNGDIVETRTDIKDNVTKGGIFGGNVEFFGGDPDKSLGLGLTFRIYHNTYRGMGYSIDPSFGFDVGGSKATGGLNFDLSFDSQQGVGFSPGISITGTVQENKEKNRTGGNKLTLGLSAGYNSRQGLTSISLNQTHSKFKGKRISKDGKSSRDVFHNRGASSTYSFVNNGYVPSYDLPFVGSGFTGMFKLGGGSNGVFGGGRIGGFFNRQILRDKYKWVDNRAYGYLNLDQDNGEDDMLDFNRENDGIVSKHTTHLPVPVVTNDLYTISGQGIGGQFRAYRSDVGILYDKRVRSETQMGELGGDVGIPAKGGISGKYSWSVSESGKWKEKNHLSGNDDDNDAFFNFKKKNTNTKEKFYFKIVGEHSAQPLSARDYMGGSEPINVKIDKIGTDGNGDGAGGFLNKNGEESIGILSMRPSRKTRSTSIVQVLNGELSENYNAFNEFHFNYFKNDNESSPVHKYKNVRSDNQHKDHHTAGFLITNTSGVRYNYCLPAYNIEHVEALFSVEQLEECKQRVEVPRMSNNASSDGFNEINYKLNTASNQFLKETKLPSYAHSYLLTSILGTDYIDVNNNGVDDEDKGYWVKFNYQLADDGFKWRAPFVGANYLKGHATDARDDKGSFMYGEKELWYVKSAETATHIAEFHTSEREDGRGANNYIQNEGDDIDDIVDGKSRKLDKIILYSKKDLSVPIQTIHFEYGEEDNNEYSLCQNVVNNKEGSGKLTLRKIFTTYGNNDRGKLNPYVFHYLGEGGVGINPNYSTYEIDRWGNYKPVVGPSNCVGINENQNVEFPYVDQNTSKNTMDDQNSAWHLYRIELPSGSELEVDYEADDYAYVQNKRATQMFQIAKLSETEPDPMESEVSFNSVDPENSNAAPPADLRKVYFNLENPVPPGSSKDLVRDLYLDDTDDLYYRIRIDLKNGNFEHIAGYAKIEDWGLDASSTDVNGNYIKGFVQLAVPQSEGKAKNFHPFSLAAWQYLRSTYPTLLYNEGELPPSIEDDSDDSGDGLGAFSGMGDEIKAIFKGYYKHVSNKTDWGRTIDLERSWIRLNSPDNRKYGGGSRVKSITINDGWSALSDGENDAVYGTYYDYTTFDEKLNKKVSSGVASYEPLVGGDEIPLRKPYPYVLNTPLKSNNDLYVELPLNESYFPSPVVGYSKVEVKSLATKTSFENLPYNEPTFDETKNIHSSGVTVHKYYTAKDFPIITDNTVIGDKKSQNKNPFNLFIPLPFIGDISVNNLTVSQGYTVELNDMHGKERSIQQYGQNDRGELLEDPLHSVVYKYDFKTKRELRLNPLTEVEEWHSYNIINSNQQILNKDFSTEIMEAGVDAEFFIDMRESFTKSGFGGVNINVEGIGVCPSPVLCIPLIMPWPNISTSRKILRTATTNKIIHRSGFMKEVVVNDNGSVVQSNNIAYDGLTGQPLFTSMNTEYDELKYATSIPGHWQYETMASASDNIGVSFSPSFELADDRGTNIYKVNVNDASMNDVMDFLIEGDEYIGDINGNLHKVTLLSIESSFVYFHIKSDTEFTGPLVPKLKLIRSGNRNLVSNTVGSIEGFSNPASNELVSRSIPYYNDKYVGENNNIDQRLKLFSYPDVINDLVGFLNEKLEESEGSLDYHDDITYNLEEDNCDGTKSYPILQKYFKSIKFIGSNNCCLNTSSSPDYQRSMRCDEDLSGNPLSNGRGSYLRFIGVDNIPYDLYYIPGPEEDDYAGLTKILRFEPSGSNTVRIVYMRDDGSTLERSFTFLYYVRDFFETPLKLPKVLPNVLNGSAVVFNDETYDDHLVELDFDPVLDCNAYAMGKKGIWRPINSFVYDDLRAGLYEYSEASGNDEIEADKKGVFLGEYPEVSASDNYRKRYNTDFHLFNWNGPNFENWIPQNTIAKYDVDGNALESYDAIGVFSSTDYGYNGHLPTSVAVNAGVQEQFFTGGEQGLEEIVKDTEGIGAGIGIDVNGHAHTGETSLRIMPSGDSKIRMRISPNEHYLISAWVKSETSNSGNLLSNSSFENGLLNWEGDIDWQNISEGKACFVHSGGSYGAFLRRSNVRLDQLESYVLTLDYCYVFKPYNIILKVLKESDGTCIADLNSANGDFTIDGPQVNFDTETGRVDLPFQTVAGEENYRLDIYMYYCLSSDPNNCDPPQYPLSAGFCFDDIRLRSADLFQPAVPTNYEITVSAFNNQDILLNSTVLQPSGLVVEGWEKIEGEYTTPSVNAEYLELEFKSYDANGDKFGFIDDLRIHPIDASMTSYVYDPQTYRLSAELDENNFATFYGYDPSGKLFVIKKETEKGIKTIKEVISNLVERP